MLTNEVWPDHYTIFTKRCWIASHSFSQNQSLVLKGSKPNQNFLQRIWASCSIKGGNSETPPLKIRSEPARVGSSLCCSVLEVHCPPAGGYGHQKGEHDGLLLQLGSVFWGQLDLRSAQSQVEDDVRCHLGSTCHQMVLILQSSRTRGGGA